MRRYIHYIVLLSLLPLAVFGQERVLPDTVFTNPIDTISLNDSTYNHVHPSGPDQYVVPNTTSSSTASVGSPATSFNVSPLGGAQYSVAIEVPKGVGGMQPSIGLSYDSQGGLGLAGWGVNISGLSVITRAPRDLFHDGYARGLRHDDTDALCLDGKRLILASGTDGQSNSTYHPEGDPYTTVTIKGSYTSGSDNRWMEVTTPDGANLVYGKADNSRQAYTTDGKLHINAWYIETMKDILSNLMTYTYGHDCLFVYPLTITYGSNSRVSNTLVNTVEFSYDTLGTSKQPFFMEGQQGMINRLLKTITSKTGQQTYREYALSYDSSSDGTGIKRPRLVSVEPKNGQGKKLPPVAMAWNALPAVTRSVSSYNLPLYSNPYSIVSHEFSAADLTGDGLADLIEKGLASDSVHILLHAAQRDSNGAPSFSAPVEIQGIAAIPQDWTRQTSPLTGDFNGDGTPDLTMLCVDYTHICHALSTLTGGSFTADSVSLTGYSTTYAPFYAASDFNGDGYDDVVLLDKVLSGTGYRLSFISGSSSGLSSQGRNDMTLIVPYQPKQLLRGDYDGDGLADLLVLHDGGYKMFWNAAGDNPSSTVPFSNTRSLEKTLSETGICYHDLISVYQGDFNGDGIADLLIEKPLERKICIADGRGDGSFSLHDSYVYDVFDHYPTLTNTLSTALVHDMDGDGRDDLVIIRNYESSGSYQSTATLWLTSSPNGQLSRVDRTYTFLPSDASWSNLTVGDFDGDGMAELMNYGCDLYTDEINSSLNISLRMYRNPLMTASSGRAVSFSDSYSNTVTAGYEYLTHPSVCTMSEAALPSADVIRAALPLSAVKTATRTNGVANSATTAYSYEDLLLHRRGRGVLGFSSISATDNANGKKNLSSTDSWNTTYLVPTQQTEYVIAGTDTATVVTAWQVSSLSTWSATPGRNYVAMPASVVKTDFDGNTTTITRTYQTNYGLLTSEHLTHEDASKYRETEYSYGYTGVVWRPVEVTQTEKQTSQPAIIRRTVSTYNGFGLPLSVIENAQSPLALTTSYTYDDFGNVLTSSQSGQGISTVTTTNTYDSTHRFVTHTSTSPASTDFTYTYDTWGNLLTETDNTNGSAPLTTTHAYDGWGMRTSTLDATGALSTYHTGWGSSASQKWFTVSVPAEGTWTKTWYDATGRETSTESKGLKNTDVTTATTYDTHGHVLRKTSTEGTLTTWEEYSYDNRDRVTSITRSTGSQTSYSYAPRKVTEVTDGRTFEKTFDAWGNIILIEDDESSVSYSYRSDGKMSSALGENRGGGGCYIGYDTAGNRNSLNDASAGTTSYTYNALGQIVSQTDARNKTTTYRYDALNRLVSENADGDSVVYVYGTSGNSKGRLSSMTRGNRTISYAYDKYGRTVSETRAFGSGSYNSYTFRYSHDKQGRLTSRTFPSMYTDSYVSDTLRIEYIRNRYGQLIGMNQSGTGASLWRLDSYDGRNTVELLGDTIRRTTALNAYGYPQQVRMKRGNSTLRQMDYLYNAVTGNLTQRTSLFLSDDIEYYSYDTADRLTEWHKDSHTTPMVMTYTENGNIYTKTNVGQYSYGYDWHHPFAVESVTNAQSLIPSSELSTEYDGRGMVSSIYEYGSWKETTFTYGPDGERWKTVRQAYGEYDVERRYLGDMEVTLSGPGMTRCNWYLGHGVMLFRDADNPAFSSVTPLYAYRDNQGSYIDFFRSNGTRVFEAKYDPWGVETVVRDSICFHRGYGGHEMLNEFGIINMNGRLYDPLLGRFLSPDNYVQEPFNTQNLNRYSYCLNNPVKYTDPDGNFHFVSWLQKNLILGALKGFFHGSDPINSMLRQVKMSTKIVQGLFATDSNKGDWGRARELISRFTWQLPQTYLGFHTANLLNEYGDVGYVKSKFGATAVASKTLNKFGAVTLGNYIIGERNLRADENNSLFQHEYGHYLQSQSLGLGYLIRVGVPSFLQASFGGNHDFMNYEQDANMRAFSYFNKKVPGFYISQEEYEKENIERTKMTLEGKPYISHGWDFYNNPLVPKDIYNNAILTLRINDFFVDYLNYTSYIEYARKYRIRLFK